jgi:predicted CXXCH cytochrome family protein
MEETSGPQARESFGQRGTESCGELNAVSVVLATSGHNGFLRPGAPPADRFPRASRSEEPQPHREPRVLALYWLESNQEPPRTMKRYLPALAAAALALAFAAVLGLRAQGALRRQRVLEEIERTIPGRSGGDEFVSSSACRACHPAEYASWHATYHRTMTQVPRGENVLGDFDGVRLEYFERSYTLERDGDELWVSAAGDRRRVVLMTGSHHYQLYWLPSCAGNWLESFPFVYLREDRRWVPRAAVFLEPPEEGLRPETPRIWNATCIDCHSTHGQPRIAADGRSMDTKVAEMGISCEACHGPGAAHAALHRDPLRRYAAHLGAGTDDSMVNPARAGSRRGSEICGQCHSIFAGLERQRHGDGEWLRRGFPYRAGGDLRESRFIVRHPAKAGEGYLASLAGDRSINTEGYFWADGVVRVSGREYNGLIESPCHQRGELSCLSCHSMHRSDPVDQLKAGMDGDEACLQCHEAYRSRPEEHTRHPRESAGGRCRNCHMPHTTYGLLKAIADHTIDSPSVETTLRSGRPNACNLCHLDRSLSWTARHLEQWYGIQPPTLPAGEESIAAAVLGLLKGDAGVRAIIAWHMGWPPALEASGADWEPPYLAQLLHDRYAAVRYLAQRSLRKYEGYAAFEYDYIGPPAERAEARRRALAAWKGPRADRGARLAEVLLRPDGKPLQEEIERLLRERDDRPLILLE